MNAKAKSFGVQALGIALSVAASLLAGVIVFMGRDSLVILGLLVSRTPWLFRFINQVYLYVFGLVWLVFWLWVQGYFSAGMKKGSMWLRFWKVIGIELILLFVATILAAVYAIGGVNWPMTILSVASLVGGVALIVWLRKRA